MRLGFWKFGLGVMLGLVLGPLAWGQNPDTMSPDQNVAKAKQLLNQAIEALGGNTYRHTVQGDCEGRMAQIDRDGAILGILTFIHSYWRYPDKTRTEYEIRSTKGGIFAVLWGNLPIKGGHFVQLFNGDNGWTMDKSGVNEADATVVAEYQDSLKRQLHNLLLNRANEEGVSLRYAGFGTVDRRAVDWLEFSDADGRTVRLALDRDSHLPWRTVASTPNQETQTTEEDVTIYSNYKESGGVQTPMQVTRERNGRRTHQIFYESCRVNPNLAPDFFTREGLEKRFRELGGKTKSSK